MILSLAPYASAQKIFREYNFRTAQYGGLPAEIRAQMTRVSAWMNEIKTYRFGWWRRLFLNIPLIYS